MIDRCVSVYATVIERSRSSSERKGSDIIKVFVQMVPSKQVSWYMKI